MRVFDLGFTQISDDSKPFLIAEIGHNHQGKLDIALEMIRAAANAGVNAVKLQKRDNKDLFTSKAFNSHYNSENAFGSTYGLHREALEFGKEEYLECVKVAKDNNVVFFATPFDFRSVEFLLDLEVPLFKIASGDLLNHPLLKFVAQTERPMIVSTGGAEIEQVLSAVEVLENANANFALLQCTAGYPPKYDELNLRVIQTYRDLFPGRVIGYSGHDNGIAMPLAAYVLGARIIEKHFTLDRTMKGTDHAFSLEPQGMKKLVRDLDRAHKAMGDGVKKRYASENAPLIKMGKMIVAKVPIEIGTLITLDHLEFRSPAEGLSPDKADSIIGKVSKVKIEMGEAIIADYF
jgi:sialic acid synthase